MHSIQYNIIIYIYNKIRFYNNIYVENCHIHIEKKCRMKNIKTVSVLLEEKFADLVEKIRHKS